MIYNHCVCREDKGQLIEKDDLPVKVLENQEAGTAFVDLGPLECLGKYAELIYYLMVVS